MFPGGSCISLLISCLSQRFFFFQKSTSFLLVTYQYNDGIYFRIFKCHSNKRRFTSNSYQNNHLESAKLCALHAKNVLTSQCALRAYVLNMPTCLECLCAHMPMCYVGLRAHVPTCLACLRVRVPTCHACLHAHVPTC